ncbi:MAG: transporter substrate-binding domain-containing protein [Gammaproteobacteria bacterium]|nr:transporter substrate-binding domain-containing protein [Gammaproteobacteria bacterium]
MRQVFNIKNGSFVAVLLLCLAILLLSVFTSSEIPQQENSQLDLQIIPPEFTSETGDLGAIMERGELRILMSAEEGPYLPRKGSPIDFEIEVATKFAQTLGLKVKTVYVKRFEKLLPALLAGQGDFIAANLTITKPRKERIDFTVPLAHVKEQLVYRVTDHSPIDNVSQIVGRTIAVRKSTSFWQSLITLKALYPGFNIEALPESYSNERIMELLVSGQIDLTIEDSNTLETYRNYRDDVRVGFDVTQDRAVGWGVRKSNPLLLEALNRFLNLEQLTRRQTVYYQDDLPGIEKRNTLRVLTKNDAASYFLWQGELMGFDYELIRKYAKQKELWLEVIEVPDHMQMAEMLVDGQADIMTGFLMPSNSIEKKGVAFSEPYHFTANVVVARENDSVLMNADDLSGRVIYGFANSSGWRSLQLLQKEQGGFTLIPIGEELSAEDILDRVDDGVFDLAVLYRHEVEGELKWRRGIKVALTLSDDIPHVWGVRENNIELLNSLNEFIRKEYKGLFYNIVHRRYFEWGSDKDSTRVGRTKDKNNQGLTPYDGLIKKYAGIYGVDWRLVAAQMYQESRFDPSVISWAGAQGLMQVLPRTAESMGVGNLTDPESGIKAGVKYLAWLRERFEQELSVKDRQWFVLASYNAGLGHVRDARSLATQKGWDADRWFDNVERAMLLLSKQKYASQSRHGYVRGREPVQYVRKIKQRYEAYIQQVESLVSG